MSSQPAVVQKKPITQLGPSAKIVVKPKPAIPFVPKPVVAPPTTPNKVKFTPPSPAVPAPKKEPKVKELTVKQKVVEFLEANGQKHKNKNLNSLVELYGGFDPTLDQNEAPEENPNRIVEEEPQQEDEVENDSFPQFTGPSPYEERFWSEDGQRSITITYY